MALVWGHLVRATAIAEELKNVARPILVSVASGIAEIPSTLEYRVSTFLGKLVAGCLPIVGIATFEID